MSKSSNTSNVEIDEADLEKVNGGVLIGLLLPAVQKVQQTAQPASTNTTVKTYVCPSDPRA